MVYRRMDSETPERTLESWRHAFADTLLDDQNTESRPGRCAQSEMSPRLSYGRHFGPALPSTRPAAVMILIARIQGQWQVPLTVRPEHLRSHAGQVSLPGGAQEPGETNQQAALRELAEELGCDTSSVEVIARLSPIYVYNSGFLVTPWVGVADQILSFEADPNEVADWFSVPIADLCQWSGDSDKQITRGGIRFSAPKFAYGQREIWGATSMILSELQVLLKSAL